METFREQLQRLVIPVGKLLASISTVLEMANTPVAAANHGMDAAIAAGPIR